MSVQQLLCLLVLAPLAVAGIAVQTDWSGGPGVAGPMFSWGDSFWSDTDAAFMSVPGGIALEEAFIENQIENSCDEGHAVCTGDIDGDGDPDVLCAIMDNDPLCWWENPGSSSGWTCHAISSATNIWTSARLGDMDGNGSMDVVAASYLGSVLWVENTDGTGTDWNDHPVADAEAPWSVCAEDVDGDGDLDILCADMFAGEIAWYESSSESDLDWTKHSIDMEFYGAVCVSSADIDGDGDADVLGAAHSRSEIAWWENAVGSGTSWIRHSIEQSFSGASSVSYCDVDGDGDLDVLGAAFSKDTISWWENLDGTGDTWLEHTVDDDFDLATSVSAADIDSDGHMDILGTSYCVERHSRYPYDMAWWSNPEGSGENMVGHKIESGIIAANSACVEDVNGDGEPDIVEVGYGGPRMSWLDLEGYVSQGTLESSILDIQESPDWDFLDWTAQTPPGTSVAFQVRASEDCTDMGDWSDTYPAPFALDGILSDGERYVQYFVILQTTIPESSPVLEEVTVTWNPLGIAEGQQLTEFVLRGAEVNPSRNPVMIAFELPVAAFVDLSVYDLSGRMVAGDVHGEYPEGAHQVQVYDLAPGIYLCRMVAGEYVGIQRFVIID